MAASIREMQQHIMLMFSYNKSLKSVKELKKVLFEHYNSQLDQQLDAFWASNNMTQEKLATDCAKHIRTPYK